MKERILALGRAFLNLIYPLSCAVCGEKITRNCGLCAACLSRIQRNDYGIAACQYEGVLKKAVRLFKYGGFMSLANAFSDLLLEFMAKRTDIKDIDVIVPVPLHPVRFRERGFNQSNILCAPIAKRYGIPARPACLVKVRHTKPQSILDRAERLRNVRRAFSVADKASIKGKNILLVDDVYTTGATIHEAARALKKAGASCVSAITLAKGV